MVPAGLFLRWEGTEAGKQARDGWGSQVYCSAYGYGYGCESEVPGLQLLASGLGLLMLIPQDFYEVLERSEARL